MLKARYPDALYLNFEDPRLYEFEVKDFAKLDDIITETGSRVLLFDEIQILDQWERYARQKLDEGFTLVITGSNASLLSRELGTKLTGRHVTKELFPFSYSEFCEYTKLRTSPETVLNYLQTGGFPEYVKQHVPDMLNALFEDILIRDIAVRYGIRDVKTLQRLALYLISNVGKLVTASRLRTMFDVGSTNTITEYLSFLQDSYLIHLVPKFDYSLRKQIANPRKVYAIDTGLVHVNSGSFSDDNGRLLENLVYLHLRRLYRDIYYFVQKGECDFIAFEKGAAKEVIQVCFELNADNQDRELNGLWEALAFFNLKQGKIVTLGQKDHFEKEAMVADVVPFHEL